MKLFAFAFLLITCFIIQSCHPGNSDMQKNGAIEKGVKNEISILNKRLFNAIAARDAETVMQLMSPKLSEKSRRNVDSLIKTFGNSFTAANYAVMDEYYLKDASPDTQITLSPDNGKNDDYEVEYTAPSTEVYTSVLISRSFPVSVLVLAVYGKYNDTWKLNILQMGGYSILDRTAPDYYNTALNYEKKGSIIDAANMILTASRIINPAGAYFKYKNDTAINALYTKVLKEADDRYQFPIDVNAVKTRPQIFAVVPQLIDGGKNKGIFPIIKYKSNLAISDTLALRTENNALEQSIGNIFKGIDVDNSHIIYQVFDQIPDGTNAVKHYGFLQRTGH